jgi:hypothetical protein
MILVDERMWADGMGLSNNLMGVFDLIWSLYAIRFSPPRVRRPLPMTPGHHHFLLLLHAYDMVLTFLDGKLEMIPTLN